MERDTNKLPEDAEGEYYLVERTTELVRMIEIPDIDSLPLESQIILYNLANPDKIKY